MSCKRCGYKLTHLFGYCSMDCLGATAVEADEKIAALRRWSAAWKACARSYHNKANVCICTYCGHETPKTDKEALVAHMADCQERPDHDDWANLVGALALVKDNAALRKQISFEREKKIQAYVENAALRQRVQELEARIERAKRAMQSTQEGLFDAYNILEYGGEGVA